MFTINQLPPIINLKLNNVLIPISRNQIAVNYGYLIINASALPDNINHDIILKLHYGKQQLTVNDALALLQGKTIDNHNSTLFYDDNLGLNKTTGTPAYQLRFLPLGTYPTQSRPTYGVIKSEPKAELLAQTNPA